MLYIKQKPTHVKYVTQNLFLVSRSRSVLTAYVVPLLTPFLDFSCTYVVRMCNQMKSRQLRNMAKTFVDILNS